MAPSGIWKRWFSAKGGVVDVAAGLVERRGVLLVVDVADALEEQQREDVALEVGLRRSGPRRMFAAPQRCGSSSESVRCEGSPAPRDMTPVDTSPSYGCQQVDLNRPASKREHVSRAPSPARLGSCRTGHDRFVGDPQARLRNFHFRRRTSRPGRGASEWHTSASDGFASSSAFSSLCCHWSPLAAVASSSWSAPPRQRSRTRGGRSISSANAYATAATFSQPTDSSHVHDWAIWLGRGIGGFAPTFGKKSIVTAGVTSPAFAQPVLRAAGHHRLGQFDVYELLAAE